MAEIVEKNQIVDKILTNAFAEQVHKKLRIDENAYQELRCLLRRLAIELRETTIIDKKLAARLYDMTRWVQDAYLIFANFPEPRPKICRQLEERWLEIDRLVRECLTA